jgi:uncharacterized repeat protein (TIGR01451 family)
MRHNLVLNWKFWFMSCCLGLFAQSPVLACNPDLAVVESAPAKAMAGNVITCTITYTNKPTTRYGATNVLLVATLPSSLSYVTNSASGATLTSSNTLRWSLGILTNKAGGSVTFKALIKDTVKDGQIITNSAQISCAMSDENSCDNTAKACTTAYRNHAPVANADSYSVNEDGVLTIDAPGVLANDTDAETNALTAVLVSDPGHGSVVLNTNGSFTYIPNTNYTGSDCFTYKANDGMSNSAAVSVCINVLAVNDAPVALPDSYSVNMESTLTVLARAGVLTNDYDVDNTNLSAVLVEGPAHGSLQLSTNGSFIYTPAANYFGPDSFTYKASDGSLCSAPVAVAITVNWVNHAPVAVADGYSVNMETTLEVAIANGVLVNDSDRDTNGLWAILVSGTTNGTVTLSTNGSLIYTPRTNFIGKDSFVYKATDGSLFSAETLVAITVNAVNHAPLANPDSYSVNMETRLEAGLTNSVLVNDSDRDTNTLTAILVNDVGHGTLTLSTNGSFIYTPNTNFIGTDSFT